MLLRIQTPNPRTRRRLRTGLGLTALAALAISASPAWAQSGGTGTDGSSATTAGDKAKLRNGLAVPPASAPRRVKRVIAAANEIAKGKGYCYGGGHSSFRSRCYDCSGAVSYALKGGNFVKRPMPSTGYFTWGKRGRGKWITVFTRSSHMYMKVAGLRFDTGMVAGKGPGWSKKMRSPKGFRKRHKRRF